MSQVRIVVEGSSMDFRLMWSNTPIPSMDNKVFVGSNSFIDLTTRTPPMGPRLPGACAQRFWDRLRFARA